MVTSPSAVSGDVHPAGGADTAHGAAPRTIHPRLAAARSAGDRIAAAAETSRRSDAGAQIAPSAVVESSGHTNGTPGAAPPPLPPMPAVGGLLATPGPAGATVRPVALPMADGEGVAATGGGTSPCVPADGTDADVEDGGAPVGAGKDEPVGFGATADAHAARVPAATARRAARRTRAPILNVECDRIRRQMLIGRLEEGMLASPGLLGRRRERRAQFGTVGGPSASPSRSGHRPSESRVRSPDPSRSASGSR